MGKPLLALRAVVVIMSAIITAIGLTLDAIQVTKVDTKWWTLISFVVFCVLIGWIILELHVSNNDLKRQMNSKNKIIYVKEKEPIKLHPRRHNKD